MSELEHPHEFMTAGDVRQLAYDRQGGYCLRCHTPMLPREFEAHHRRPRLLLGWCPCNIVALHPRCHTQGAYAVHDHVRTAVELGLIVPARDPREPCEVPLRVTWPWEGMVVLSCTGMLCSSDSTDLCT